MSYNENSYPEYPGHVPAKRRRRWIAPTAIGAVALLAGVGIGAAGEKTEVVTVEAEPITKTVTEEVEVQVTPEACIEYIALSEQVYTLSSDMVGYSMDMLDAVDTVDVAAAEAAVAGMDRVNTDLDAISDDVVATKEACRGEGA
jgi:hypothetical protein